MEKKKVREDREESVEKEEKNIGRCEIIESVIDEIEMIERRKIIEILKEYRIELNENVENEIFEGLKKRGLVEVILDGDIVEIVEEEMRGKIIEKIVRVEIVEDKMEGMKNGEKIGEDEDRRLKCGIEESIEVDGMFRKKRNREWDKNRKIKVGFIVECEEKWELEGILDIRKKDNEDVIGREEILGKYVIGEEKIVKSERMEIWKFGFWIESELKKFEIGIDGKFIRKKNIESKRIIEREKNKSMVKNIEKIEIIIKEERGGENNFKKKGIKDVESEKKE